MESKPDITVNHKPTHADRYLQFSSHHPTHVKKGLVRCLYDCTRSITKEAMNLKKEKAHLAGALQQDSYTAAFITAAAIETTSRKLNQEVEQEEGKPTLVMLPYVHVADICERIRKVCRSYIIREVSRSAPTFRSVLTKFEVPCTCGN